MRRLTFSTVPIALAIALLAPRAEADVVTIPVLEDVAPYSFVPNALRWANPALWAFQALDENELPHDFESYLWFDVSLDDVPAGQYVTQALLRVTYSFDASGFGDTSEDPGTLDCHEVIEDWDHQTLTWNNRPDIDPPFDSVPGIDGYGVLLCDATEAVLGWLYGVYPNYGVALTSPTARTIGMHGSEAAVADALKPALVLTTEVPEPGVAGALGVGAITLGAVARRRRPRANHGAPR